MKEKQYVGILTKDKRVKPNNWRISDMALIAVLGGAVTFGVGCGSTAEDPALDCRAGTTLQSGKCVSEFIYCDADGDRYTVAFSGSCPAGKGTSTSLGDDCNDDDEDINPVSTKDTDYTDSLTDNITNTEGEEDPDGLDNDCDGVVDEHKTFMFITSVTTTGKIDASEALNKTETDVQQCANLKAPPTNGLAEADAICTCLAKADDSLYKEDGRTWKAWLSDYDTDAKDREGLMETFVAENFGLWARSVQHRAGVPMRSSEFSLTLPWEDNASEWGQLRDEAGQPSDTSVWTGTVQDGTHSGRNCNFWRTANPTLGGGQGSWRAAQRFAEASLWTENRTQYCSTLMGLYCVATD